MGFTLGNAAVSSKTRLIRSSNAQALLRQGFKRLQAKSEKEKRVGFGIWSEFTAQQETIGIGCESFYVTVFSARELLIDYAKDNFPSMNEAEKMEYTGLGCLEHHPFEVLYWLIDAASRADFGYRLDGLEIMLEHHRSSLIDFTEYEPCVLPILPGVSKLVWHDHTEPQDSAATYRRTANYLYPLCRVLNSAVQLEELSHSSGARVQEIYYAPRSSYHSSGLVFLND